VSGAGVKQAATASFAPGGSPARRSISQSAATKFAADVSTLQRMANLDTVPSPEDKKGPQFSTGGGGGGRGNDDVRGWGGRGDGSDSDSDVEDDGEENNVASRLGAMLEGAVADARRRVARISRFNPGDRTATLMNMGGAALTFGGGVELGYRMPRNFVPAHDNVLLDVDEGGDVKREGLTEYSKMPHNVLATTHSLVVEEAGRLREENARLEASKRMHERANAEQRRARDTLTLRIDSLEEMNQKLLKEISKGSLEGMDEKGISALEEAMAEAARLRNENERLRRRVESGISAFVDPKVMADDRQALRDGVSRLERYHRSIASVHETPVREVAPAVRDADGEALADRPLVVDEERPSRELGLETVDEEREVPLDGRMEVRMSRVAPGPSTRPGEPKPFHGEAVPVSLSTSAFAGESAAPVPALRGSAPPVASATVEPPEPAVSPYVLRQRRIAYASGRMSLALREESDDVEVLSRRVQENDTLYRIAQAVYGEGSLWPVIVEANPHMSRDQSDYIYAGDMLSIPVPTAGSDLARELRDTLNPIEA